MKKLILLTLCCGLTTFANAENFLTLADEQATLQLCQKSAETFNDNLDVKVLVNVLRPYFPLPEKMDASNSFEIKQLIEIGKPIWGDKIATVHIDSKKFANDNFIQHRFLLKRSNSALYYQCTFYKPMNKWQLLNYSWDGNPYLLKD